ncbi:MAG: uncharacterized protein KVP18_000820 [Porospora cf. gigantea A]|uniref:uncharacterized protein n=2 Tax=Porospora cf. gigantea A TaxID=2853593 RepID=UPI00355A0951|nr:MAG: hypothetical protein KVP18_000820 [Porospora cf. gigantea A]
MSFFNVIQRMNEGKEAEVMAEITTTVDDVTTTSENPVVHVRMVHAGKIQLEYFDMDGFLGKGGIVLMFLKGKQLHHVPYPYLGEQRDEWNRRELELVNAGLPATLPVLWHNDRPLGEATTILRYLAKKLGEYGSDHLRDAYADMIVESLDCWRAELSTYIGKCMKSEHRDFETNNYWSSRLVYLQCLERMLKIQLARGGGPYTLARIPSWVDFFLWGNLWDDFRIHKEFKAWVDCELRVVDAQLSKVPDPPNGETESEVEVKSQPLPIEEHWSPSAPLSEGQKAVGDFWRDQRETLKARKQDLQRHSDLVNSYPFEAFPCLNAIWVGISGLPAVRAWSNEVETTDGVRLNFNEESSLSADKSSIGTHSALGSPQPEESREESRGPTSEASHHSAQVTTSEVQLKPDFWRSGDVVHSRYQVPERFPGEFPAWAQMTHYRPVNASRLVSRVPFRNRQEPKITQKKRYGLC